MFSTTSAMSQYAPMALGFNDFVKYMYITTGSFFYYRCSGHGHLLQTDWWSFLPFPPCSFSLCLLLCGGELMSK